MNNLPCILYIAALVFFLVSDGIRHHSCSIIDGVEVWDNSFDRFIYRKITLPISLVLVCVALILCIF